MPSYYPEGNVPGPSDTEVRSLAKIADLCRLWAVGQGLTPTLPWLGDVAPKPADTEVPLLQKINASLYAIAGTKASYFFVRGISTNAPQPDDTEVSSLQKITGLLVGLSLPSSNIQSVVAGTNIVVNNADPFNPIISRS
jgi:hypothetical protein